MLSFKIFELGAYFCDERRISGPFFAHPFLPRCQRKWKYVTHTIRFSVFQQRAASRRESFDVAGLEDGACREVVSAPHVRTERLQPAAGGSAPLSGGGGPSAVRHERPPASAALFADGQMTQTAESSHARLLLAVDHRRPERRRARHPTCSLQFARCQNKVSEGHQGLQIISIAF
jgi:hypothetical protein